ncbi:MAG: hypothetical protein HRT53_10765 [Colwellia sp.]|nr:hypothetical protein [Colwellia sp.]
MVKDDQVIYQGDFGSAAIASINEPDTLRVELMPETGHGFTFQCKNEKVRVLEFFNEVFEKQFIQKEKMGWLKGLEPSTTGITILLSVKYWLRLTYIKLDISKVVYVIN